jgi:NAD(P)-dependent dehydrogenase (short-subunit alcohol dehydrogenase family)
MAIRKYLEGNGEKVIGVDVRDAEVIADLSTEEGRGAMIDEIGRLCGGKLDGVVAGAGLANRKDIPGDLLTSVNYFGAVATLDGLRPMLAKSDAPRAVGIGSNTMSVVPIHQQLLDLYLAGDEAAARELSNQFDREDTAVYGTSKFGFARWIREHAIKPEWIGSGITLNAIAPGVIATPMAPEEQIKATLALGDIYPMPAGRAGTADEIAGLVGFLLSERAGYCVGTVIFIDGGTEAAARYGDSPAPLGIV